MDRKKPFSHCNYKIHPLKYVLQLEKANCNIFDIQEDNTMRKKNLMSPFLATVLAVSMLGSYGNIAVYAESEATETEVTESTTEAAEDQEAEAQQLMKDLTGTYQELWPVILDEQYDQIWLDNCKELVGEDNAQAAFEKLSSMVSGEIYGEEAVEAYADGNGVYDCHFTEDVNTLEFDGETSTIKDYDADDNELFSHTYHYVGMEEVRGLYEFESDDADSGEFTYFCIAPDTSATTYHIELRYGSDLDALGKYDEGDYAYWLGSGISTEYDQTMVEDCIKLFCTENLSE